MSLVGTPRCGIRTFGYQLELECQTPADAAAGRPDQAAVAQLEIGNCCLLLLGGRTISSIS